MFKSLKVYCILDTGPKVTGLNPQSQFPGSGAVNESNCSALQNAGRILFQCCVSTTGWGRGGTDLTWYFFFFFFFFFLIRCTKKNGDAVNGIQFKLKLRDYLFSFKYYFTLVMHQSPVHIFPILTTDSYFRKGRKASLVLQNFS